MNIIYISASKIPSVEANSVQVARMCDNFAKEHDVLLVCRRDAAFTANSFRSQYGLKRSFRVIRLWWPKLPIAGSMVYALQVFLLTLFQRRPDVFYGRHLLSLWLVKSLGVPVVYEAHMPAASRLTRLVCGQLFRSRRFHKLVCVSEKLRSHYESVFSSITEKNSLVAPNGADQPTTVGQTKAFYSEEPVIGYIGSAKKEKGIDLVLDLARRMPAKLFCIAGPSREALNRQGYEVPDNVELTGFLTQQDVTSLMQQLTVVLAPYKPAQVSGVQYLKDDAHWGSPLKIFEFMAAGKCIVASDIEIVRELLRDGVEGVLCPPGEVETWRQAIEILLGDEAERNRLSINAEKRFVENFDRSVRARRVLQGL